jgi:chromosome partitioning protein
MPAKIIAAVNQKGGSGKTTLSMQLAGALARRGHEVLIVDADPQGTATRWAASAEDDKPFPATVAGLAAATGKMHREVKKYVDRYDYIIIDCPPAVDSLAPQSALLIADLAVVPVIPSPPDLWASVGITKLIENARTVNEDLQAVIVLNQCQPQQVLTKDAMEILKDFQVPLAKSYLGDRAVYRQSSLYGQTVHDMGARAEPAIREVTALTEELLGILDESQPETEEK